MMANSIIQDVVMYASQISMGVLPSCTKHRQACTRFIRDVRRSSENCNSFPYYFDSNEAEKALQWSSLFRHTKGVLRGKNIDLHVSLKFVVANIYGWYHKETKYRRFDKFYFQVARKNAKSQLASIIALYELMAFRASKGDIKDMAEVYTAATKRDQARIVYDECVRMLRGAKSLKGRWKEVSNRIEHIGPNGSGSFMRALSKEDKKRGDGYSPQCSIVDEYHAHPDTEMLDVLDSGDVARPEPLLGIITTAGFNTASPCFTVEYELVSRILNPLVSTTIENYFCDVHELEINTSSETITTDDGRKIPPGEPIDDPLKEANWVKANPVVCSYPEGIAKLRKKVKEAVEAPDKMRNFLTKHMDIWVNDRKLGYMNLTTWRNCGTSKFPDVKGNAVFIGVDLSKKEDLTSVGVVIPLKTGKHAIKSYSFIPEEGIYARSSKDKVPFDLWRKQGWIHVMPGKVIDPNAVVEFIQEEVITNVWTVTLWCFDPWHGRNEMTLLEKQDQNTYEVRQGAKTLSEPLKAFRNMAKSGNIVHDGNPVLTWAIGNTVVDIVDRNENIMLNKTKSPERIDPLAAVINAFSRAYLVEAATIGGYNVHEMRSL